MIWRRNKLGNSSSSDCMYRPLLKRPGVHQAMLMSVEEHTTKGLDTRCVLMTFIAIDGSKMPLYLPWEREDGSLTTMAISNNRLEVMFPELPEEHSWWAFTTVGLIRELRPYIGERFTVQVGLEEYAGGKQAKIMYVRKIVTPAGEVQ